MRDAIPEGRTDNPHVLAEKNQQRANEINQCREIGRRPDAEMMEIILADTAQEHAASPAASCAAGRGAVVVAGERHLGIGLIAAASFLLVAALYR